MTEERSLLATLERLFAGPRDSPLTIAAFLEGLCSWAPSWLYCLDERWEKFGNERRYGLTHPPSYYFRRQCFLSADPDEDLVVDTIKALGDENIVISTTGSWENTSQVIAPPTVPKGRIVLLTGDKPLKL